MGPVNSATAANSGTRRTLAKRSCLVCREKKARCELPDIYVDSSKTPLETSKKCHRCKVLVLECVVFDGDRKRKPNLQPTVAVGKRPKLSATSPPVSEAAESPFYESELNETRVKDLLRSQRRGWTKLWRPLSELIDRLQQSENYNAFMTDKIRLSGANADLMTLLDRDADVDSYLVWHPYLPPLTDLYDDQVQIPTRPRALLLATLCLLGSKSLPEDHRARSLRKHIDQLGIELLLSAPRDIHLVMAFLLLIMHEPGLVGVSIAANDTSATRGLGLASENLLLSALKIAQELGLDQTVDGESRATHVTKTSLWSSLKVVEGLYSLLGSSQPVESLDVELAARLGLLLGNVDGEGHEIRGFGMVSERNESTDLQEIREGFVALEKQIGSAGVLRAAGRTISCLRLKGVASFHDSLRQVKATLAGPSNIGEKRQTISDIALRQIGAFVSLKSEMQDSLRWYANRRCIRVCEQWAGIECDFIASIFCSSCIAALFNGTLDRKIDSSRFIKEFRQDTAVGKLVSPVGVHRITLARQVLASIGMLDQQPLSKAATANDYLRTAPTLLTATMTVDAAKTFLEAAAFTLVAYGRPPSDADVPNVVMRSAAVGLRRYEPLGYNSIASIAAEYIGEMVDAVLQWNLYYSVYRHVPLWKSNETLAMDQLASAAEIASSTSDANQTEEVFEWGRDSSSASSASNTGGFFDLQAPFDLDAFLHDNLF